MLDIFIVPGIILALFLAVLGRNWKHEWPYYFAAGLFLIIGTGILMTGWETFQDGNIVITDTNATVTTVEFQKKIFPATIEDNPILVLEGTVFTGLGLVFVFLGLAESRRNKALLA